MADYIKKYKLKIQGLNLEKEYPEKAIEFYKKLLKHKYFINDYYPYRRLALMYKTNKENIKEINIIKCFFKSEIYCNKHYYYWFRNKLRLYSKKSLISDEEINELTDYFKTHALKNKDKSNQPVPIADRLKTDHGRVTIISEEKFDKEQKIYELEEIGSELKRQGKYQEFIKLYKHMINNLGYRSYRYYKSLARAYRNIGDLDNEFEIIIKYYEGNATKTVASEEWFNKRLKEVSTLTGKVYTPKTKYSSESFENNVVNPHKREEYNIFEYLTDVTENTTNISNVLGTDDEYIYTIKINPNFEFDLNKIITFEYDANLSEIENIKRKIILREQGRQLTYKKKYKEAISFHTELKNNTYFTNDWYPYRQLTIIYDKTKEFEKNLRNIKDVLLSGIYLNGYQLIWFTNKIRNITKQITVDENEIQEWLDYYENNGSRNKHLLNKMLCDRTNKKDDSYKVLSEESFDIRQQIYEIDEIGRIYERVGNYELAASHYQAVIQDPPKGFNEKIIEKYNAKLKKASKKIKNN